MNIKLFTLFLISICFFGTARAEISEEVLRDANGNIRYMTQFEASGVNPNTGIKEKPDACEAAGKGHLPTAREFMEYSQTRGAKGILEANQVDPYKVPAGYNFISVINPNGQKDEFYFNSTGYQRPEGDLGWKWFWSSSIPSIFDPIKYAASFISSDGVINYVGRDDDSDAVRCMFGR